MNKRSNKILCSVLALCMASSVLSGCGSNNSSQSTNDTADTGGAKRTLTVEVFDRGKAGQPSLTNNFWTRYIQKNFGDKNNCTVQFVPVPRSQEVDKLNVLMAAHQAPDISLTYDIGTVTNYIKQGGLTELDDLIQKYGPTLTKYLGDEILKYGKFDGKMYAVPAKRTILMAYNTFIRKDWLDKLGLPLPTTRDEFYNDLVAFRDKNPGGVSGVIPLVYGYTAGTANMLDSFFPADTPEEQIAACTLDANYDIDWKRDGFKDYLKFMNKLYHEKLISQDFATNKTGAESDAAMSSGKGGAICSNWDYIYRNAPGIYTNLKKNVPGAELVPVDCFKNSQGKYAKKLYAVNGMYILVPKDSKNADLAIKYLDWMADIKNTIFLQNGEEGVDYTMENGIPVPKDPSTTASGDKMITVAYNGDYDILTNGPELGDDAKNREAIAAGYPGYEEDVKKAITIGLNDGYFPFYFEKPNTAYSKYSKTLLDKNAELVNKLIMCSPSQFDGLFASAVNEYMQAGGQEVYDENLKLYKEQKAKG